VWGRKVLAEAETREGKGYKPKLFYKLRPRLYRRITLRPSFHTTPTLPLPFTPHLSYTLRYAVKNRTSAKAKNRDRAGVGVRIRMA